MSSEAQDITSSSTPVSMSLGNGSGGGINKLQRNAHRSPEEEEERNSGAAMKLGNAEYTTAPQLPPPTSTNNVGELVTKAKKAAASLWMILHAQVCFCWFIASLTYSSTLPLSNYISSCIISITHMFIPLIALPCFARENQELSATQLSSPRMHRHQATAPPRKNMHCRSKLSVSHKLQGMQ